jgi:AcrR family transcriptional regulator
MLELMRNWRPQPSTAFYKKQPESSELGRRIISEGLIFMQEIGFEAFTFKKLADRLQTTEASVYRYFENKHHLLLYYMSIYWLWLEYHLTFGLHNLPEKDSKLNKALDMITRPDQLNWALSDLSFDHLLNLVVTEWGKIYFTSQIDKEEQAGLFADYKRFCKRLSKLIAQSHPHYPYPNTLVSTAMNMLFVQRFYADHLPSLTDLTQNDIRITDFIKNLVNGALQNPTA